MSTHPRFNSLSLMERLAKKDSTAAPSAVAEVRLDRIKPDENQPRKTFDPVQISELAATIKEIGLIEPLVLRPDPNEEDFFILIAGERRYRAAQEAGLTTVPAVIRSEVEPHQIMLIQLVENLQRVDLKLREKAEGFQQLEKLSGLKGKEVARLVGLNPATYSNYKRVLSVTGAAAEAVDEELVTNPETLRLLTTLPEAEQAALVIAARKHGTTITRPLVEERLSRQQKDSRSRGTYQRGGQPTSPSSPEEAQPSIEGSPSLPLGPAGGADPGERRSLALELRHLKRLFQVLGLPTSDNVEDMEERLFRFLESLDEPS